ncbi:MAG TPA: CDF family Co(II)/Ni(II) efflux transporter DmeF [Gammaproteobacteria bacterium]|nr:CDF family Co(II)/Ni(II) efflux transporter DmeF [Gammaproteobacteria bacterium]
MACGMTAKTSHHWQHDHIFGQDQVRHGERRTLWVIGITAIMMVVEITTGLAYGSMALLADGLHMASHTAALGITTIAYIYTRRRAADSRFSFGTGKVNAFAGYTSAVLLALFALLMAYESIYRLVNPVQIAFNQAIFVAVLGLLVNGASMLMLGDHPHDHDHGNDHDHGHGHDHDHPHGHAHKDHNLRAAYLHVLADALTSLLAIFALLAGKFLGLNWMDPLMGVVGALLIARWSMGLIRDTSGILLDHQAPESMLERTRAAIEGVDDNRITDLHIWSIGPGIYSASLAVVSGNPKPPQHYKGLIPGDLGIVHTVVEVHRLPQ